VGPTHGGVEFSKGALPGFGSYATALMTRSRRGITYIDNQRWGPEADSIESGYRVPFGKINIFIGMIGSSAPEPDICRDKTTTQALPPSLKISVCNTSSSLISSYKALTSIRGRILLWLSLNFMISPSACHSRIFAMFANYLTLGIFMNLVHGTWKLSSIQLL